MTKKIIYTSTILLIIAVIWSYLGQLSIEAYHQCLNYGVQSNDVCRLYSM